MYPTFSSIEEAKKKYRRCRNVQFFILDPKAANTCVCAICRGKMGEDPPGRTLYPGYRGNRCEYHPKTKQVVVMHYVCSFESLLNKIVQIRE